jgi:hypothetical protein
MARLNVALQRIGNSEHEPNLLVTRVSAVEALARSLLVHHHAKGDTELMHIYERYRSKGPQALVEEYFRAKCASSPADVLGNDTWELFDHAVYYRNLLVHECTYLGQDKTPVLIEACRSVLLKLAVSAGLPITEI